MNFFGCVPRFLKAHGGWVLTALGSFGLVGTVILTAKEAPKARDAMATSLIDKVDQEAFRRLNERRSAGEENLDMHTVEHELWEVERMKLTEWERMKAVFPVYLPAILVGTGTLACFWGAQIFNVHKQTALIAAYGTLALQFDQYREAIRAEHGDESDRKAYAISQMKTKQLQEELKKLKEEYGPKLYEFATLPGVIFEEFPKQISSAFMHFNRNMMLGKYGSLAELYTMAGIPESTYDVNEASGYGWTDYENEVTWGTAYTDFSIEKVTSRFGKEVNIICPIIPPFELEVDYGFEGDPQEHLYSGYDIDLAKAFARECGGQDVVKVSKDWECYVPGID